MLLRTVWYAKPQVHGRLPLTDHIRKDPCPVASYATPDFPVPKSVAGVMPYCSDKDSRRPLVSFAAVLSRVNAGFSTFQFNNVTLAHCGISLGLSGSFETVNQLHTLSF